MPWLAIGVWVLGWSLAGFLPTAFFAARDHKVNVACIEVAIGVLGILLACAAIVLLARLNFL